jgi:uncharacterized protein
MTEQERQLITALAERVKNAPAPEVDRDADDLIRRTIGSRPDALYILTQTVLIQEMALNQAKAQIEDLKQKAAAGPQAASQSSFLPAGQRPAPGGDWGREGRVQQPPAYPSSGYSTPGYQAPPPLPQQQPSSGGFSGFLRNAATTAAGVVAGELAFESLSSLFGHRGGFFGGGGGLFSGGAGISPGSETIINNYYGDERGDRDDDSRFAAAADQSDQDISRDIDDERDASDNSGDAFVDDSSLDDSSGDDDSSFDNGGSFDDDGGSF